jgi:hypothetical protein
MRWLIALVFLYNLSSGPVQFFFTQRFFADTLSAQASPVITPLDVQSVFGDQITFRVRVQPIDDVSELVVYITPEGQPTFYQKMDLNHGNANGEFDDTINAGNLALFPFSQVAYYFKVTLKDNRTFNSETSSFTYADDRFMWQTFNADIFQISWYSPDSTLGQEIANIAQEGLQRSQGLLSVKPPGTVRIYAYATPEDMQSAIQMTDRPWVDGQAIPELSMIIISVPAGPEKTLELRRKIPHEIMHLLQYEVMSKTYTQQPVWLVEGMASLAETSENPEYRATLKAKKPEELFPFRSLCVMFPKEAGAAFQAYAQSESFVAFLQQKYGNPGLLKLIDEYKNGVGCEEGVSSALGISLNQLQYRWEQEVLGVNVQALAFTNLLPYLLVGLFILVPAAMAFFPARISKRRHSKQEEG